MKNQLFYSILRYRHGLILGETLNAGILFFDPKSRQFSFEKGELKRVAASYPNLQLNFLKNFIGVLEQNIKKVNGVFTYQVDSTELGRFVSKELLFSDAAGLTFDAIEEIPLSEKSTFEHTKDYLIQLFLVGKGTSISNRKKRNEEYILEEVNRILKDRDTDFLSKIERNRTVQTELVNFTFDFYWKSSDSHFAKAISLDLEQAAFLQNKALQIYGALEQLKSNRSFLNSLSTIDVLLTKPHSKSLFKEFDKAVQIIDSIALPHQIWFEESWKGYAEELIDSAENLNQYSG